MGVVTIASCKLVLTGVWCMPPFVINLKIPPKGYFHLNNWYPKPVHT